MMERGQGDIHTSAIQAMLATDGLPTQTRQSSSRFNCASVRDEILGIPKRGSLKRSPVSLSRTKEGKEGEREGAYDLVTTLTGLDVTDFTHFCGGAAGVEDWTSSRKGGKEAVRKEGVWVVSCVWAPHKNSRCFWRPY